MSSPSSSPAKSSELPTPRGLYTADEWKCLEHLIGAWNAFVNLKPVHDDHQAEFRHAIHIAQNIVGVRVLGRELPGVWAGVVDGELKAAKEKFLGKRCYYGGAYDNPDYLTGPIQDVKRAEDRGMAGGGFVCSDGRFWRLASMLSPTTELYCDFNGCKKLVAHAEHWHTSYRLWCTAHTPWSGHHENCGETCTKLLYKLTAELGGPLLLTEVIP